MFKIHDVTNIGGEIWFLVQKTGHWVIQRNSIGFPRHIGRADYINRVWRKKYLQGVA